MTNVTDYLRQSHMPHIWCPGCGNGIVMGNIIRAIDELGLDRDKTDIVCRHRLLLPRPRIHGF